MNGEISMNVASGVGSSEGEGDDTEADLCEKGVFEETQRGLPR